MVARKKKAHVPTHPMSSILVSGILATADNELENAKSLIGDLSEDMHDPVAFAGMALKHFRSAQTLIELVEVYDCGSVGGFSVGQKKNHLLRDRLDFLIDKYGAKKLEPVSRKTRPIRV